jgi:hypothetical protein
MRWPVDFSEYQEVEEIDDEIGSDDDIDLDAFL